MIAIFQAGYFRLHHIAAKSRWRSIVIIRDEFQVRLVCKIDEWIFRGLPQIAAGPTRARANQRADAKRHKN